MSSFQGKNRTPSIDESSETEMRGLGNNERKKPKGLFYTVELYESSFQGKMGTPSIKALKMEMREIGNTKERNTKLKGLDSRRK